MSTDDSLFDEKPNPTPAADPTPDSQQQAQPDSEGTGDDPVAPIAKALEQGLGKLQPLFQSIEQRLGRLEESTKPSEDPGETLDDNSLIQQFASDPEGFFKRNTDKHIKESVGPLLDTWAQDKVTTMRQQAAERFDSKYGEGSFEKFIAPDLGKVLEQLPPQIRSSAAHFNTTIDTIIGRRIDELAEARSEAQQRQEEAVRRTSAAVLPSGRPRPRGQTLSDEEKQLLQALERDHNERIDPKQWVADRDRGETEDDWLPVIQAEREKSNAA